MEEDLEKKSIWDMWRMSTGIQWCKPCNYKRLEKNFNN